MIIISIALILIPLTGTGLVIKFLYWLYQSEVQ